MSKTPETSRGHICMFYTHFVCVQYTQYLESYNVEEARAVFKRACEIHLTRRPNICMQWATFEERHGRTRHSSSGAG